MTFVKGMVPLNKDSYDEPNEYYESDGYIIMIIRRANSPDLHIILDKEVHEKIRHLRWFSAGKPGYNDYAYRKDIGKLHRHILGIKKGDERRIDHINRNRFDNRLSNLRIATQIKNMQNHGLFSSNSSGYNGVHFSKDKQKFQVYICYNYKQIHVGFFNTLNEAMVARQEAEKIYWK
jgi:hypothetical protein